MTASCDRCKHYIITWDPGAPYGCKAWGIKSRQRPSAVVLASSGLACKLFEAKTPGKDAGTGRGKQH